MRQSSDELLPEGMSEGTSEAGARPSSSVFSTASTSITACSPDPAVFVHHLDVEAGDEFLVLACET